MDIVFKTSTDIDGLVSTLYMLPNKVQFCHHLTKSYAAHKALDGAYDALNDLKDSIVEKLIGYTGKRFNKLQLDSLSNYSESMNNEVAQEIIDFGAKIQQFAKTKGYPDIENLGQDYSGEGAQLAYLLTLK